MDILVYGAGVIGSIYAARLQTGGNRVSVLARGQRFEDIRTLGVVVEDILTGVRSTTKVAALDQLDPSAHYDLALIAVRRDQLASVIPVPTANRHIPTLLFMLNNPIGSTELIGRFGKRVMLGFPGAGGTFERHVVRYAMITQQPTMLGEPDGSRTARAREIAEVFRLSGLKTRAADDMDGWLKAHAFFVTAISGAIYLAGGDPHRLSNDDEALRLMADGVREGFATVRALGDTVSPLALRVCSRGCLGGLPSIVGGVSSQPRWPNMSLVVMRARRLTRCSK
jgi:2-dehydropantoate 2-reductase